MGVCTSCTACADDPSQQSQHKASQSQSQVPLNQTELHQTQSQSQSQQKPEERKPAPPKEIPAGWIFGPSEDINKFYKLGKNLGQPGQFGRAVLAEKLDQPKEQYAVKIISKSRFSRSNAAKEAFEAFRQEVDVMRRLRHQNVIRFYDVFEDRQQLFLVMELCAGGELFDRITERQRYSERDAAVVLKQAFEGIKYMHSKKIAHCDLKPDNFLFLSSAADAPLKIIDFGMSKFVKRHEYFRKFCGTPYYVAPEVIDGKYNESCDIWSLGVVMFVMLHGYPPFYADPQQYGDFADERVYRLIKRGFQPVVKDGYGAHFPKRIPTSESARDLITTLLCADPLKRPTAQEALDHPWFSGSASDAPLDNLVVKGLMTFNKINKFKESVLRLMAQDLSQSEIDGLKQTFTTMDQNHDGVVTIQELKQSLQQIDKTIHHEQIQQIMQEVDLNEDGVLNYDELMLTFVNRKLNAKEERLWSSFCKLDLDGDGRVTVEELKSVLKPEDEKLAQEMLRQADQNKDGLVDYEEFLAMFHPVDAGVPRFSLEAEPTSFSSHPLFKRDSEVNKPQQ